MPAIASTGGRLHSEFVRLLFLQAHRETDRFFAASGVQSAHSTSEFFHFRRATFLQQLKSKVGLALAKAAAYRIVLNLDGESIASKSHTQPSHSETSRLLTSSLSLGVPVFIINKFLAVPVLVLVNLDSPVFERIVLF